ncbi:MAG: alanine racemase [Burkholderiales bacterium]|nr:alanine racemase [Burkholderiales bacterium]
MPRPIVATIDSGALRHNLNVARALTPGAHLWAVVKANAYGHGIEAAVNAFADADGLALIELENAVRLRELGWKKPLLLLEGCFSSIDWHAAAEHRMACVIHCDEQLSEFEATPLPRKLDIYVKFNTGMNRLGFRIERARDVVRRLMLHEGTGEITLMTHFACADERDGHLEALRRFSDATSGLPLPRSLANSAACFDFDRVATGDGRDSVRPGIMLYGATPFTHATRSAASLKLRPAMTLSTEIIGVQSLRPGDAVGYGATYVAARDERVAVIAAGYADGYPRHAPSGTPVLVNGQRTRLVGRVSMDKIAVDVTDLPLARVGTPVELWGAQLAVDEVANAAGTIGYESLTAVSSRVPRRVV